MQISEFRTIYTYRDLLVAWTVRTVRARYQQSVLGGVWAVLQPAATVAIFTIIFTRFVPIDTGGIPYVVFSYSAMVPWMLFSTSITDMVDSLVVNMNLIGKIYFPREVLPLAALFARLLDFIIAESILIRSDDLLSNAGFYHRLVIAAIHSPYSACFGAGYRVFGRCA
jgi:lipopolysaccharide transport system permease protein